MTILSVKRLSFNYLNTDWPTECKTHHNKSQAGLAITDAVVYEITYSDLTISKFV